MDKETKNQLDEDVVDVDADEVDDADDDKDDEFEYDDDGNIIIPDVIDEGDEDEEVDVEIEQDENEDEEESDENEGSEEEDKSKKVVEPAAEDSRDVKIAELEKELKRLKSQGKETLSKLGVKSEDLLEGLETLAAESDDVPVEEYRKKKTESERTAEAQRLLQKIEFDKKAAADLAELQQHYPETKSLKSILEIENLTEFGRLRDLGLSAKQAYAAANPDGVKSQVAQAVKQQSLNDTKKHLQSAVPKGSKDNSITMTKSELSQWRDMFPKMSDKEIAALYKSSKNK